MCSQEQNANSDTTRKRARVAVSEPVPRPDDPFLALLYDSGVELGSTPWDCTCARTILICI